jgi:hypothetical protein
MLQPGRQYGTLSGARSTAEYRPSSAFAIRCDARGPDPALVPDQPERSNAAGIQRPALIPHPHRVATNRSREAKKSSGCFQWDRNAVADVLTP